MDEQFNDSVVEQYAPEDEGDFEPLENEWFEMRIAKNSFPRLIVGKLTNGEHVFVNHRSIRLSPGGCCCNNALGTRTVCSARIQRSDPSKSMPYQAIEVVCDQQPKQLEEVGTIISWHGSYGSVVKPCRCEIFALTASRSVVEDFEPGQKVRYKLERSTRPGKNWLAKNLIAVENGEEN